MEARNEDKKEEDSGPSVDSNDQEERIAARRLRIQRRLEAAKREALGENVSEREPKNVEQEQRKSSKQVEESYQRLLKLRNDGSELVSNVKVACHAREDIRRNEEDEIERQRREKTEAEAKSAIEKFDEVTKKWDLALSKETPQDLHEMLIEQKAACDAMIDEKNRLIDDLQQELKSKDDQYVKDLRKQAEDIDLMVERMEEQVKTLLRVYKEELTQIDKSFESERRELIESNLNRWETLMKQRGDKEIENMVAREKRVSDFENQLQTLRIQDAEEYNMVKIKLETDVQILEQNLQQMKATYQLNQEKLEYNFQVLKKRDEENTITKSQQKRKITRLQDLLNNLKQKAKKQEKQYRDENQSLTDDLKRITEQYKELQKKFRHFQATDERKFNDIWLMNEESAKQLVRDVLKLDEIIFEQQLGLNYQNPDLEFMANVGPLKTSKEEKKKSAVRMVEEILSGDSTSTRTSVSHKSAAETPLSSSMKSTLKPRETPKDFETEEIYTSAKIKEMLELLCNESGFLVEAKLLKLLSPLDKDEQSLMKLDAIFNALGIETEEDINLLAKYFYKVIPDLESSTLSDSSLGNEEHTSERSHASDEEESQTDEPEGPKENKEALIHPNDVLFALRKFVEDNREPMRDTRRTSFRLGARPFRDESEDEDYWKKFGCIVDERLWDALITGFERYNEILTDRAKFIQTNDALRQQNSELRMLLHQYINSKINQELEIPPTKVLQIDGQ